LGAYLVVFGVILLLEVLLWVVTREAATAWVLLGTVAVGLALPILRLLLRRGAPDDKFPWE
jgi:hypothetical protein